MTTQYSTQQFEDSFTFPFRDPDWKKKMLIGCLLSLAIYTIVLAPLQIVLMGYFYRIMKRIIVDGGEPYLPEWEGWGILFIDGLKLIIPGWFFSLPGLLLLFLSMGGSFLSIFSLSISELNEPFMEPLEPLIPMLPLFGMLFFLLFFGLGMIFIFALGLLHGPAICHVVATDQISGAFRIKEWWKILKTNFLGFILAYLMMYCITMVLTMITQILSITIVLIIFLPVFGAFIGLFASMVFYSLLAKAYITGKRAIVTID